MTEKKRALITGITGQDGSYLAELLLEKDYEVYGFIRRLSSPNPWRIQGILDKITLIEGDLQDQASINYAVKEARPHELYNLAAQSFVATSWQQPLYTSDVTGTGAIRVLEAVRLLDPECKVYQASTSELYGKALEKPQKETTPFYPRSPYAFSKLMAYWAMVNYRESFGIFAANGILFNHESPRRGIEFVTRKITDAVARIHLGLADELSLGNMDALRDWGFAGDYVVAMWLMLQQDEPVDYIIATGENHSVRDFVKMAFARVGIMDWEQYVKVDQKYMRPAEVIDLLGDSTKAKEELGWEPKTGFEELVNMMVDSDVARWERKKKAGL